MQRSRFKSSTVRAPLAACFAAGLGPPLAQHSLPVPWTSEAAATILGEVVGPRAAVSVGGCCANAVWCELDAQQYDELVDGAPGRPVPCFTHNSQLSPKPASYRNVGWLAQSLTANASAPMPLPLYACTLQQEEELTRRSLQGSARGRSLQLHAADQAQASWLGARPPKAAPPQLRAARQAQLQAAAPLQATAVYPSSVAPSQRMSVWGVSLTAPRAGPAGLDIQVGGATCAGIIDVCSEGCAPCSGSNPCAPGFVCVTFSGSTSTRAACVAECRSAPQLLPGLPTPPSSPFALFPAQQYCACGGLCVTYCLGACSAGNYISLCLPPGTPNPNDFDALCSGGPEDFLRPPPAAFPDLPPGAASATQRLECSVTGQAFGLADTATASTRQLGAAGAQFAAQPGKTPFSVDATGALLPNTLLAPPSIVQVSRWEPGDALPAYHGALAAGGPNASVAAVLPGTGMCDGGGGSAVIVRNSVTGGNSVGKSAATPTPSATATGSPSASPSASVSASGTVSPSASPTVSNGTAAPPTSSPSMTATPSSTPTSTGTVSAFVSPSGTGSSSPTPSGTTTASGTASPSPSIVSPTPTPSPSPSCTASPSVSSSVSPHTSPSSSAATTPSNSPSPSVTPSLSVSPSSSAMGTPTSSSSPGPPALSGAAYRFPVPLVYWRSLQCTTSDHCATADVCTSPVCVSGCCVYVPTGHCSTDTVEAEARAPRLLPQGRRSLPLPPPVAAAALPVAPPLPISSCNVDTSAQLGDIDDAPLSPAPLRGKLTADTAGALAADVAANATDSHWAFPLYRHRFTSLHMGSNGILQAAAEAPCGAVWANPTARPSFSLCFYTNAYFGLVAPLSTDWNPAQSENSSLSLRVLGTSMCASWYNVPLFTGVAVPGEPAGSFEACLAADGGVHFWLRPQAQSLVAPASIAAGAPPTSTLTLPATQADPQAQQWISGVRSPDTVPFMPSAVDADSAQGALTDLIDANFNVTDPLPWEGMALPGSQASAASVVTQDQVLFRGPALRAAQQQGHALATCSVGSAACMTPRCGTAAGGTRVIVHWSGAGCGLRPRLRTVEGLSNRAISEAELANLTSYKEPNAKVGSGLAEAQPFSWAPWVDAGTATFCAFGGVPHNASAAQVLAAPNIVPAQPQVAGVVGLAGQDVGATSFTCDTPPLAAVLGTTGAEAVSAAANRSAAAGAGARRDLHTAAQQTLWGRNATGLTNSTGPLLVPVPVTLLAVLPGPGGVLAAGRVLVLPVVSMQLPSNGSRLAESRLSVEPLLRDSATPIRRAFAAAGGRVMPLSFTYQALRPGDANVSCDCAGRQPPSVDTPLVGVCNTVGMCVTHVEPQPAGNTTVNTSIPIQPLPSSRRVSDLVSAPPPPPGGLLHPADGQVLDCAGVPFGEAGPSACGSCTGGTTGLPSEPDCAGVCGGSATLDCAGVCNGQSAPGTDGGCCLPAAKDCTGVCGGSAIRDCTGVCGGSAVRDCGGTCRGRKVVDCSGVCGGSAFIDTCGRCAGGSTGLLPCASPTPSPSTGAQTGGDDDSPGTSPTSPQQRGEDVDSQVTRAILIAGVAAFGGSFCFLGLCYARMRWRDQPVEFAVEDVEDFEQRTGTHGLPAVAIAGIPKQPFTAAMAQGPSGDMCIVCQDTFKEGEPVAALVCKHIFHPACVEGWLRSHTTCPTCRYELEGWVIESGLAVQPPRVRSGRRRMQPAEAQVHPAPVDAVSPLRSAWPHEPSDAGEAAAPERPAPALMEMVVRHPAPTAPPSPPRTSRARTSSSA